MFYKYKTVSVCIITSGRSVQLNKCLTALSNQSQFPDEVIIVDNSIDDKSKLVCDKYMDLLSIKYLHVVENGVGYLRNICLDLSKKDILVFLDDDAYPIKSWIKNIIFYHNKYLDYVCLVGESLSFSKNKYIDFYTKLLHQVFFKRNVLINGDFITIDTKNASFKKKIIDSLNLRFDVFFKTNGEDIDFANQLLLKNQKIRLIKNIFVYHEERKTFFSFLKQRFFRYEGYASRRKWHEYSFTKTNFKKIKFNYRYNDFRKLLFSHYLRKVNKIDRLKLYFLHILAVNIETLSHFYFLNKKNYLKKYFSYLINIDFRFIVYSILWVFFSKFNNKTAIIVAYKLDWPNLKEIALNLKNSYVYAATSEVRIFLQRNGVSCTDEIGFPKIVLTAQYLNQKFTSKRLSTSLIFLLKIKKVKKIQVFHGIVNKVHGYVKSINSYYDLLLTSGEYQRQKLIESGINEKYIKTVGYSKFDKYLTNNYEVKEVNPKRKFTILYAPTWGNIGTINLMIEKLVELNNRYNLIVKPHYLTESHIISLLKDLNIYVYEEPDITDLFGRFDLLITDSSSVMFESLITKKPIIVLDMKSWITKGPSPNSEIGPEIVYRDCFIRVKKIEDLDKTIDKVIKGKYVLNTKLIKEAIEELFSLKKIPSSFRIAKEIDKFCKKIRYSTY